MLELSRLLPVGRCAGPIVGPHLLSEDTGVDHGLNRKHVAWLHDTKALVLGVVGNRRSRVEQHADTVPAEGAHYREAMLIGMLRDNLTNI